MAIVIVGAEGNIGRRLRAAFPGAIGIDRAAGATSSPTSKASTTTPRPSALPCRRRTG